MPRVVSVLNGPILNLSEVTGPDIHGLGGLADIEAKCRRQAKALGLDVTFRQSNHEGQLVDWIQEARLCAQGVIINAGGYSHTSVAILDALLSVDMPVIEVHLSNIHRRESFRRHSYISPAATGVICGFGVQGYMIALDAMGQILTPPRFSTDIEEA